MVHSELIKTNDVGGERWPSLAHAQPSRLPAARIARPEQRLTPLNFSFDTPHLGKLLYLARQS